VQVGETGPENEPSLMITVVTTMANSNNDKNVLAPARSVGANSDSSTVVMTSSGQHAPVVEHHLQSSFQQFSMLPDTTEMRAKLKTQLEWYFSRCVLLAILYLIAF